MKKSEFKQRYNLTEKQFTGKQDIKGDLDLGSVTSLPDGFNPTVGGYLYLRSVTSLPDGFNPTVGGDLDLRSVTSLPDGFNPTVGGYLYLRSVTSLPDGFNPTVGGYLDLRSVTSLPDGFNPTVGGYLYLGSVTSLPDGFNPTVGGYLYLGSVTSLPDGFNPAVGGDLYLRSVTSLPDGFNPTVGGDLYLRSDLKSKAKWTKLTTPIIKKPIIWPNEKYIKADGIFTEIVHQKGNVYQVRKINQQKVIYLVTDGNNKWAHGDTLKDARENLIYKIGNRDTSKFKGLPLTHVLTFSQGIEAYRTITGACSFGTQDFVKSSGVAKKSYTIAEIIELTKGRYGSSTFAAFFGKSA